MWNKAEEMAYWYAEADQYYFDNIHRKYFNFFDVDSYFSKPVDLAVDIGGGRFGGALHYFQEKAKSRILVDVLATEFRKRSCFQYNVDSITADFADIPLKDKCADVVFAWNVYDHADNLNHFEKGVFEAFRILKVGGLFFGSFPLRKQSNNNHPFCLTRSMVYQQFRNWDVRILSENTIGPMYYKDDIMFIVVRKT
jgi:SAM-dependent methyltransferase